MFLHFRRATVCPNSLIQSQGQMKGVSYKTKKNILACFPPSANWQLPWKQKGNTQDFCQLVRLKDEQLVESSELLLTQGSFCKSLFVPLSISISEETYFNLWTTSLREDKSWVTTCVCEGKRESYWFYLKKKEVLKFPEYLRRPWRSLILGNAKDGKKKPFPLLLNFVELILKSFFTIYILEYWKMLS